MLRLKLRPIDGATRKLIFFGPDVSQDDIKLFEL